MMLTTESAAWYLAGIIDGEGWVSGNLKAKKIEITNTDESIIEAVQEALDILGIEYRTKWRQPRYENPKFKANWQDIYTIRINKRQALEKLAVLVELQSVGKRQRLKALVSDPRKQILSDDPRISEVYRLYCEELLSHREVADRLGMKRGQVARIMLSLGIRSRSRSEAQAVKYNREK